MKKAADILDNAGITATPNRLIVVDALLRANAPLALADLETMLPTMERSGIFRVLSLLADSHVAHTVNDGTRSLKYELCPSHGAHHSAADHHVHFHCTQCGRTFCLDTPVPAVALPEGYKASSANYVIEGTCAACSRR
ncbi:MAG: transcriptional repressor [Muribaculaceae bacterium]|nr:transcriptional repressor [Muribaculaceae bacterium]